MQSILESSSRSLRRPVLILVSIAVVLLAASVAYVFCRSTSRDEVQRGLTPAQPNSEVMAAIANVRSRPHVVFLEPQSADRPRIAFAPLDDLERGRIVTEIRAERVYAAGRQLVCLGSFPSPDGEVQEGAFILDENLHAVRTIPLTGLPSRVRASRDGALAAVTLFVAGDSYAGAGFSTRTYIFDLAGKLPVRDIEKMKVTQGDDVINPLQMNFWGVTFDEPPTHYLVTLRVGEVRRLVDASLETSEGRVIHAKVECPSLSPDRTRIGYKRLAGIIPMKWRLAVLDLASDQERVLPGEKRSIDDQVEWLDGTHILYGVSDDVPIGTPSKNVWSLDVDSGQPALMFLPNAQSPCVVRP